MTQNVVLAVNTSAAARTPVYFSMTGAAAAAVVASAAARTPVYFSMTGAAAAAVVASSSPLTAAQTFSPYLTKYGVGSTVSIAVLTLAAMSAMYRWCRL